MKTSSISIAMATFNGARFLEGQLDSFVTQTRLPAELVVSDDGSTDQTLEILQEFSRRAPFDVRIHQNPQTLGFADNFMQAVSMCRGDLIAFSDQDDVWLPEKLARSAEPFTDPAVAMTLHCGRVVDADLVPLGWSLPAIAAAVVLPPLHDRPTSVAPGFAQMFRANLPLLNQGGWRWSCSLTGHPLAHDQWVYYLAWTFGKISYMSDELVLYRRHASTTTRPLPFTAKRFLQSALSAGSSEYESAATFYGLWGSYLCANLSRLTGTPYRLANEGAQYCNRLEQMLRARSTLYQVNVGVLTKFGWLANALASGYYHVHQGKFGVRGFFKDLFLGVCGLSRYAQLVKAS